MWKHVLFSMGSILIYLKYITHNWPWHPFLYRNIGSLRVTISKSRRVEMHMWPLSLPYIIHNVNLIFTIDNQILIWSVKSLFT